MMKKTILSVLVLLLSAMSVQAQLLWKVSGNGLAKPSYVMGTYHFAQVSFLDSVAGYKDAFASCGQVYAEVNLLNAMSDMSVLQSMQQSLMMPAGKTIDTLLTPEQMERLNAAMREYMGADFTNPMLAALKQMKPAAFSTQLIVAMCAAKEKNFDLQQQFDLHFLQEGQKQQKKIGGLETLELQTDILYNQKSLERQAEELMCLIDNKDYQLEVLDRTIAAYYAQDLQAIEDVTEEKMNNACDPTPEEENILIYNRNAAWAKAIPDLMKADATFVAVGAAHLPGDKGLLQLLRNAGFTVEAVK